MTVYVVMTSEFKYDIIHNVKVIEAVNDGLLVEVDGHTFRYFFNDHDVIRVRFEAPTNPNFKGTLLW